MKSCSNSKEVVENKTDSFLAKISLLLSKSHLTALLISIFCVQIEAACSNNDQRRPIVRPQLSSLSSTVSPTSEQDNSLSDAFEMELQCVGSVGSLLNTIPDEMCYLNKDYKTVADTGNRICWTGRSLGS